MALPVSSFTSTLTQLSLQEVRILRNLLWLHRQEKNVAWVPPSSLKAQPGLKGKRTFQKNCWGQSVFCLSGHGVWQDAGPQKGSHQCPHSPHFTDEGLRSRRPGKSKAPYTEPQDACAR